MSILKGKSDAGQGGKRGHSNMDHWEFNDEIKTAARKRRRLKAKVDIRDGLNDLADITQKRTSDTEQSNVSDELPE